MPMIKGLPTWRPITPHGRRLIIGNHGGPPTMGMMGLLLWVWWASYYGYGGPPTMGMVGLLLWV